MTPASHPDLIVGSETSDDAAVWRLGDGTRLVSSADFFAPIVDDARTWGHIAAANSASDIYAMGGRPLFALNLVGWPREVLPLELLGEVLAGGADAAAAGGWVVAGGHTIDAPEPLYGMSVTGMLEGTSGGLLTNGGGRAGQALVLTKPLGTGLLATAVKRSAPEAVLAGGALHSAYIAGIAEMSRLNDAAAQAALAADATAATDVTGFGLLGHLAEMTAASGVGALIDADAVPLLPDAVRLAQAGFDPGGTQRNLDHLSERLTGGDDTTRLVLSDPQTSGGLLFSCTASAAADAVRALCDSGHRAAVIGELVPDPAGTTTITGNLVSRSVGDHAAHS